MIQVLKNREAVVIALLVALVLLIGFFNPNFLRPAALINVANSSLVLMLIAMGEMFVS